MNARSTNCKVGGGILPPPHMFKNTAGDDVHRQVTDAGCRRVRVSPLLPHSCTPSLGIESRGCVWGRPLSPMDPATTELWAGDRIFPCSWVV